MEALVVQLGCAIFLFLYLVFFCSSRVHWFFAVSLYVFSVAFSGFYFLCDAFTGAGVTEAVFFHALYGLAGVNFLEFVGYVLSIVVFAFFLCFSVWFFLYVFRRRPLSRGRYRVAEFISLIGLGLFSVGLHPAALQSTKVAVDMWQGSSVSLDEEMSGFEFSDDSGSRARRSKSLVYIYVESFERTFLKENVFPGLAPNFVEMEKQSLHFEGVHQSPLTDWTIAGMVASQCGMPLATFTDNRNDFSSVGEFVPGATCLGEVLKTAGYHSVFMGGADLSFAGKGRFYRDHGFDEVIGRNELQAAASAELPLSKWGVYDDALMEQAYDKFTSLFDAGQPFALVMLTLDTHPPIGHVTPSCRGEVYGDGHSKILNAVKCSDRLVSDFVKKIESYAGGDVMVVVASDHLQMRNDIYETLVSHDADRENLFMVRGSGFPSGKIVRSATTLDIFPTLLHLLGWDVEGAALGRNLLKPGATLSEKYGREQFYATVQGWRLQLWESWSPSFDE